MAFYDAFYVLSACFSVIILCTECYGVGVFGFYLLTTWALLCVYIFDCEVDTKHNLSLRDKREYQIISKNEGVFFKILIKIHYKIIKFC